MLIGFTIIILIALSFFVSKKNLKLYYIVCSVVLAMLFFTATPGESSDLYRHLHFLKNLRSVSWNDILMMRAKDYGEYFSNLYIPKYPLFCIYSKIMSYFPEKFYVMPVSILIYLLPTKVIFNECKNKKRWAYILAYAFFIITIDFVSISAIRNIFVSMTFCYILYAELIEKKNRLICWGGYLLLSLIHSYAFVLIFVRVLLLISNKYSKYIICFLSAVSYGFIATNSAFLIKILDRLGEGRLVSILKIALNRGVEYSQYLSDDRWKLKALSLLLYILSFVFVFLYVRDTKIMSSQNKECYKKLYTYYVYFFILTLSCYSQFDMFTRGMMVLMPISGIFVSRFMDECMDFNVSGVVCKGKRSGMALLVLFALEAGVFLSSMKFSYSWINDWWR